MALLPVSRFFSVLVLVLNEKWFADTGGDGNVSSSGAATGGDADTFNNGFGNGFGN